MLLGYKHNLSSKTEQSQKDERHFKYTNGNFIRNFLIFEFKIPKNEGF